MAKTTQINPDEQIAREYADRLILAELTELQNVVKLSEIADRLSKEGLGLAEVRSLLASNPHKFAYNERRWMPASRLEGADKPFAEQIRLIVDRFGGPMPLNLVLSELNITQPDADEEKTLRVIKNSSSIGLSEGKNLFLKSWVFAASDEPEAVAYELHGLQGEDVIALASKLDGTDFRDAKQIRAALAKAAPVSAKLFGAVAFRSLNPQDAHSFLEYDWKEFNQHLFSTDGFVYSPDGILYPAEQAKKWLSTAIKVADKLAPSVEIEDAAPIEVKAGDVDKMVKKILASEPSITATKLLEEFYEITPTIKTFPDDLANLMDALKAKKEVLWVGGDRFNNPGVVPEIVDTIKDFFTFVQTDVVDAEGEFVDCELNDDGLSSTLRKLLNHPLAMDVNDEDINAVPKQVPETIRCVLKSAHRELGTFPLCQIPIGWIPEEPKHQEIILRDRDGRELQVWANIEDRLLFGFIDWFFEQQVESGAVFSLTSTPKPNVFDFAWLDQTDPVVFITSQRMEELRELQGRSEGLSTFDVVREVMSHWPKGADFLTLLWEVNVVRRVSRRLVASLLSSYACFYQRSGSPVWHYDAKKVEQGFDKTKRKFVLKR
ncbi:MAG: hypothetical protein IT206_02565 [Fimbriimonadaceae bacterium]|nr:hypothetical protein [Fimbriimonadaceae bacterium]